MHSEEFGERQPSRKPGRLSALAIIGPGLLVAATGVGAGDLATAAFTGIKVGTAVLWAVLLGAFLKFMLNEGLARWQLATGTTLLEGAVDKLGVAVAWVFLPYLFVWSYLVALALMSACGVTMHAIAPVFSDAAAAKIVFGIAHGLLGLGLVLLGGFRLFEKVMSVCIGVMFVTVVVTACLLWPGSDEVLRGLFVPGPATLQGKGFTWTVALMGGVGGTVTVLCYGYWIREKNRTSAADLAVCRIDLGVGYAMTALFGIAMVIIGSRVPVDTQTGGALLIVNLADKLGDQLGPVGRWAFLAGAWGAVFSSLLGVWQAVPYLFADFWGRIHARRDREAAVSPAPTVDTKSFAYRAYLFAIAILPMTGLPLYFVTVQKFYAVLGACFIPILAVVLLILNGRHEWVGERLRNRGPTVVVLMGALVFFCWFAFTKVAAFVTVLVHGSANP